MRAGKDCPQVMTRVRRRKCRRESGNKRGWWVQALAVCVFPPSVFVARNTLAFPFIKILLIYMILDCSCSQIDFGVV